MYDTAISKISKSFTQIKDHRKGSVSYSLHDTLMAGLAVFCLKDPSLLSFMENYVSRKENLEEIFKIKEIPSENGLRKILDRVDPMALLPSFQHLFEHLEKEGFLSQRALLSGHYILSVDGTGTFASNEVSCSKCLSKKLKNGTVQYHHQLLAASLVKPGEKTVFPVFGEAITRQDGSNKNDCERNACKRLLPNLRKVLPEKKLLILLDALYADGPTIKALKEQSMSFFIVIKEGYVLEQIKKLRSKGKLIEQKGHLNENTTFSAKWANSLTLNGANQEIQVHYLEYEEFDLRKQKVVYSCKWISDLEPSKDNFKQFVAAARSRWKIENETFNTLKNRGYNLEHNYGHGQYNLATNFALLTLLAFFVDQIMQAFDEHFELALEQAKTLRDLRQKVRVLFDFIPAVSMNFIYQIIARKITIGPQM